MAGSKKIILVITNSRGANQAFVTEDFKYLLLDKAIGLARRGVLAGVHVVEAKRGAYLRSTSNSSLKNNLDNLSVPAGTLSRQIKDSENERVSEYTKAYGKFLELKFTHDELLYLGGVARIKKKDTVERLRPLVEPIKRAAKQYRIDTDLLAAILIDELARIGPDDLLDILGRLEFVDTSVGLAQIKLSTARDLVRKKYYRADPDISHNKLYDLLIDDPTSIEFAAAYLKFITDFRVRKNVGTSAAQLASCYSEGLLVAVSPRGRQIADKLRRLAREILE